MINQTELELFIKLQPFFKERMGEWQDGDKYYCFNCKKERHWIYGLPSLGHEKIWLPRTIDGNQNGDEEERRRWERSLLGILLNCSDVYDYKMYPGLTSTFFDIHGEQNELIDSFRGASPTEAILRALCAQEGIK